ncbi:TrpB-like pyridoxal phosphate-dependent enzyme [Schleiferia thermophila]|jgi:tryptophan synthase beta chain|uniref:Tryptophan synthase beta chain n=1 Tax=Schleiferia thermophila TaxID=884107 RepID=A0A368ZVQ5_9FLAO|nr:TrpB-like pyridoxal phosphate-dependent enzyme [Schleiferia thermophila]KFD39053.1 tryptophan synthase subunit beta [Schleiferia thermophila str. Yellowstone]RCX01090.1 tryptophan synthase beta chain [Schleiferia thermophila]GCD80888.1 tryptophan synthase beta chain [Schleiferia thermophila]
MKKKIILEEEQMPRNWYNILADMPNKPLPPLHPGTKQPVGPEDLAPLFPMELIKQEVSTERFVEIPEEIRNVYKIWRPTPMFRAYQLEKALDTPAKIYYKYEGVSPSGSHKPNTAVAQAYYNKKEGVKRITTETGAGQWGTALAFACKQFEIECEVYMVKVSYNQKPYRKVIMKTYGAQVYASPSERTNAGRAILAKDPDNRGSLGIAISEAVEMAAADPHTKYALGSVLNHVLMHQTIIGEECRIQLEMAGDYPDIVIAPLGGGSNFAGISFPFLRDNLTQGKKTRCIAVEPASCPKLTKGKFMYDFGDTAGYTPLLPMYTLGHNFMPAAIHAGGLRYHGASVICSQLLKDGIIEAVAIQQLECFKAGLQFAETEGILPAPEATHAIAQVIREANRAKEEGVSKTILFNLCGHGYLDMQAYEDYFAGKLTDHTFTDEELYANLEEVKNLQPA